jgi:hypothetical protein
MFGYLNNGFDNDFEPNEFYLSPNYPNPFKEKTKIKYCVAYTTRVRLTVFDSQGNEIQILVDEEKDPGTYEVVFQSTLVKNQLTVGIYNYCLEAGDYRSEMKMELQK